MHSPPTAKFLLLLQQWISFACSFLYSLLLFHASRVDISARSHDQEMLLCRTIYILRPKYRGRWRRRLHVLVLEHARRSKQAICQRKKSPSAALCSTRPSWFQHVTSVLTHTGQALVCLGHRQDMSWTRIRVAMERPPIRCTPSPRPSMARQARQGPGAVAQSLGGLSNRASEIEARHGFASAVNSTFI